MRPWMTLPLVMLLSMPAFAQDLVIPSRVDFKQLSPDGWQPDGWVRVWGWSKDGRIAYSKETLPESEKGLRLVLSVKNLVTDEESDSLILESSNWTAADLQKPQEEWAGTLYKANKAAVDKLLTTNKIVAASPSVLEGFPLKFNGFDYSCNPKVLDSTRYEDGTTAIGSYEVAVARSDGRRKTVYSGGNMSIGDLTVYGYFRSPFENRIAIAFGETSFGEAARSTALILIGSSLSVGF